MLDILKDIVSQSLEFFLASILRILLGLCRIFAGTLVVCLVLCIPIGLLILFEYNMYLLAIALIILPLAWALGDI